MRKDIEQLMDLNDELAEKDKEIEKLQDKILKLETDASIYKDLSSLRQEKINKAIGYINNCIFDYEENTMIGEDFKIVKRKLLGSDKE